MTYHYTRNGIKYSKKWILSKVNILKRILVFSKKNQQILMILQKKNWRLFICVIFVIRDTTLRRLCLGIKIQFTKKRDIPALYVTTGQQRRQI